MSNVWPQGDLCVTCGDNLSPQRSITILERPAIWTITPDSPEGCWQFKQTWSNVLTTGGLCSQWKSFNSFWNILNAKLVFYSEIDSLKRRFDPMAVTRLKKNKLELGGLAGLEFDSLWFTDTIPCLIRHRIGPWIDNKNCHEQRCNERDTVHKVAWRKIQKKQRIGHLKNW